MSSHIPLFLLCIIFSMFISSCSSSSNTPQQPLERPEEAEMKTIGIIGGISWVSSIEYYRMLNEKAQEKLGGLHSAKVLMYSIEFANFSKEERLAKEGNWEPLKQRMVNAGQRLERGGADFILIASNTMHSTAHLIQEHIKIPILSIIDVTAQAVKRQGLSKIALLGTKYTMEQPFYRTRLENVYGLTVVTPNQQERDYINTIIFDELCAEKITTEAHAGFLKIIHRLIREEGVEGIIMGCTEIPLLIHQKDVGTPLFDSMSLHVDAALEYATQSLHKSP